MPIRSILLYIWFARWPFECRFRVSKKLNIEERVYALAEQALGAGQQEIPVHVFPFRMTPSNLEQHSNSPWRAFWSNLKVGYDAFEATRTLPVVYACRGAYLVEGDDPTREANPPADCAVQIPLGIARL